MIRLPAVAGVFYSGNEHELKRDVVAMLGMTDSNPSTITPKAIIVPHAGYVYSGRTAAVAYARLAANRKTIKRIILLGPAHRTYVRGLAVPSVSAFATPLGLVELDAHAINSITGKSQIVISDAVHSLEHSLEVQLPFLQEVLDDFKMVPIAVGDASPEKVADILNTLWGGPETVIVISSDLSHYLPYSAAQSEDNSTVQNILEMRGNLTHQQACGGTPINGLILAAKAHHLHPKLLSMCNSGDTAGDKQQVVGYASIIFTEDAQHA